MMFRRRAAPAEPICAIAGRPCPRTSDPKADAFCPFWAEHGVVWTNTRSGEEQVEHCGARMLVPGLIETIKASNRPAAAIERAGNDMAGLAGVLRGALRLRSPAPPPPPKLTNSE